MHRSLKFRQCHHNLRLCLCVWRCLDYTSLFFGCLFGPPHAFGNLARCISQTRTRNIYNSGDSLQTQSRELSLETQFFESGWSTYMWQCWEERPPWHSRFSPVWCENWWHIGRSSICRRDTCIVWSPFCRRRGVPVTPCLTSQMPSGEHPFRRWFSFVAFLCLLCICLIC